MKRTFLLKAAVAVCLFAVQTAGAQEKKMHLVAANDCGVPEEQPFLVKGENYTMPATLGGSAKASTCNFGNKIIYAFNHLDIHADYRLEVAYLSDGERIQHIVADGNEVQAPVTLTAGREQRYCIDLPRKAYAYGQLVLVFELAGKGPNAIVSELNLYSSNPLRPKVFEGEEKRALASVATYKVDTTVNVEPLLPDYAPRPAAVAGVYRPELSLNGSWLFCPKPVAGFEHRPAGEEWKTIVVPGQWSMQGFEVDSAGIAAYRRHFSLPADWQGRRVRLRFDGVHSEYRIFVNGQEAGYHLGGMTPFETDITQLLRDGGNELALAVRSESMADMLGSLTQYAAHQLGGITRKVTLFAVPPAHLADLRIDTRPADSLYRDAVLGVETAVRNDGDEAVEGLELRLSVDGLSGCVTQRLPRLMPGETWRGTLTDQVEAPAWWNNERPALYTLRMTLLRDGLAEETVERRFGFREVKVSGQDLLVNGRPVKLRGVCHHEMHPTTGRSVSTGLLRRDMELYREANCNFVRTSHYPPSEELLDACDELGLFVEVEAPVCWIGHHANENWKRLNYQDPQYYGYIRQATLETIHFNRNHPSVLFWSMANESYWNKEFAQVEVYVGKADRTRPHTFHDQAYGGFNNQGSTAPIANIHYPGPDGYKVAAHGDRPMVYGEYCHLNVYNRSELVTDPGVRCDWALALRPAWENMYATRGVLGGSIWSGIDDIFQLPDGRAVGYGAWGPIDGWRRPKPEYWDMKKCYSPVHLLTRRLVPGQPAEVEVENRHAFVNLSELRIDYDLDGRRGTLTADIAPAATGRLSVPAGKAVAGSRLHLTFTDPRGYVCDEYVLTAEAPADNTPALLPRRKTHIRQTRREFMVEGKDFRCVIDRTTGLVRSLGRGGRQLLQGGPLLMALPLTGGGCYPDHNAATPPFNDVCHDWRAESVEAHEENGNVRVTVRGAYREFCGGYSLTVNAGGTIEADYDFEALTDINPRQWGLVFEAPAAFSRTYWSRRGQWSVYPADHIGRPEGEALVKYPEVPDSISPRQAPSWPWSHDGSALGSNDFRATRRNIRFAGLADDEGEYLTALSDGTQHWRAWRHGDGVRFLVADFVTAGNEMFLESYYAPLRRPLRKGDHIKGHIVLYAGPADASIGAAVPHEQK